MKMQMSGAFSALVLAATAASVEALGARQASGSSARALLVDSKQDPNRPVNKVIELLHDMLDTLQKDQKTDQETYDKMSCWCEDNDKEKTKAISDADARIVQLKAEIEAGIAGSERLKVEIQSLEEEIETELASLAQATEIRKKQYDEFNNEEKDLIESISALKAAIVVLSKHHESAMLQANNTNSSMLSITSLLKDQMQRHEHLLRRAFTPSQQEAIEALVQGRQSPPEGAAVHVSSYNSQSGEIYGILNQMLETFESDLTEAQKNEEDAQQEYSNLKSAKEKQISASQGQLANKKTELAQTHSTLAQNEQDLKDTEATLAADEQYLTMLKAKCQLTDQEWDERQKTRQDEIAAINQALTILSADDASDTFSRTFNPASFLQVRSDPQLERREKAAEVLGKAATKANSTHLSSIAVKVKIDSFTEVKEAIDTMISQLLTEKEDEIKHRDTCTGELHTNELQTAETEHDKETVLADIESLDMSIDALTKEIDELNTEITDLKTELSRAGENRESENVEFQAIVADQKETQRLLKEAKQALIDFYGLTVPPSLVQKNTTANSTSNSTSYKPTYEPSPDGFEKYEHHGASNSVIALLDQIIRDTEQMEADSLRAEQDSQKAYEAFVQDTNRSVEAKEKSVINKDKAKSTAAADKVQKQDERDTILSDLELLSHNEAQTHANCDFVLKNFDIRQEARDEEVEALREAKSYLSGAIY